MVNSSVASPVGTAAGGLGVKDLRGLPAGLVATRTWLSTIHLLAGLPIGIATFTVVITGMSLGVGLLPLFLIGIPVLSATIWVATASGQVERARFALLLGQTVPPPLAAPAGAGWWHPIVQPLRTASAWRQVGYCLLRLPLGAIEFSITLAIWSIPLALITLPTYDAALPGGAASIGGWMIRGPLALTGAVLTGLVLLLAAPLVVGGLAALETALARLLLGPGSRGLAARVAQLEDSRARVVDAAEAERLRIERDLHDGAQQRLVSMAMELGRAKAKFGTDPEGARDLVDQRPRRGQAGPGGAAPAGPRRAPAGAHRPRPGRRRLRARRPLPDPGTVSVEIPERPSLTDRVDRLLRGRGGPHQRRQARPGAARRGGHPRAAGRRCASWCATTASVAPTPPEAA